MSESIICSGKTRDEAIEEACRQLGISRYEADVEILEYEQKKLFKSIPAKVRVTKREPDFSVKDFLSSFGDTDGDEDFRDQKQEKKETVSVREEKPEVKKENKTVSTTEEAPKKNNKKKKKKKNNQQKTNENAEAVKTAEKADTAEEKEEKPEIIEYITEEQLPERAVRALDYLKQIVAALGFEKVEYAFGRTEKGVRFVLSGDDAPSLIGRRGETMDALQYLCTVGSSRDGGDYCRISLDIEGYRSRRNDALIELAAKTAAKVKKNGYSQTLDPMNPYERRIIHAAIQEIEGVSSHSVGSEPYRKVVVTLEGASQDRRNRSRRNSGHQDRKPKAVRENTQTTEPVKKMQNPVPVRKELKSQEEFVGALYGKIEL